MGSYFFVFANVFLSPKNEFSEGTSVISFTALRGYLITHLLLSGPGRVNWAWGRPLVSEYLSV